MNELTKEQMREELESIKEELELIEAYNERGKDSDKWKELDERMEELEAELNEGAYTFRQVPWDQQTAPLREEIDWYDNCDWWGMVVAEHKGVNWGIPKYLQSAVNLIEEDEIYMPMWEKDLWTATADERREYIDEWEELFPPQNREHYTFNECVRLAIALTRPHDNLAEVFNIIEGREVGEVWKSTTIRGCTQSDWSTLVYLSGVSDECIRNFEAQYFNTGSEWIDGDGCSFYSRYSPTYETDELCVDLAEQAGVEADRIVLDVFRGWIRTASYTTIGA